MGERYVVVLGTGTLREETTRTLPHQWTPEGVSVRSETAGLHDLHLAVAEVVLDGLYRTASDRGMHLNGVQVRAEGAVEPADEDVVALEYSVAVDSAILPEIVDSLISAVDLSAALPATAPPTVDVRRVGHQ